MSVISHEVVNLVELPESTIQESLLAKERAARRERIRLVWGLNPATDFVLRDGKGQRIPYRSELPVTPAAPRQSRP